MIITYIKYALCFFIFTLGAPEVFAQNKFNLPTKDQDKIRFELINNLIILPVELNGVKLSFLLDSGVSKPILFNITNTDSLQINEVETIFLRGLGGGEAVRALRSRRNFIKIGDAININQDIYVVFDQSINFTPRLGVPIHGIIGYDLFKDFVVEINYRRKFIKLHKPETYTYKDCRKCTSFNLNFHNDKPYIEGNIEIADQSKKVKLLIDSGSSDGLWLFENDSIGIISDSINYFEDFLGRGLSGNVYGKRSKIDAFSLDKFQLTNVNVAFPDSTSISHARLIQDRNGSLSGEILKRFHVIMDYPNSKISLRKNKNFNDDFRYNRSGIVLEQRGQRIVQERNSAPVFDSYGNDKRVAFVIDRAGYYSYKLQPAFKIVDLRKNSPAEKSGLMTNDQLLSINGKSTLNLKLEDIMGFFQADYGKTIRVTIERDTEIMKFQFDLENPFKQEKLP
ncbi:PDZ domain-containing protein [Subsaximicrobium wynnwilliamsii]|uniref:PDZ domain-containing protein n=1 Tax=Subsaximicrobium wynnwilliamsii TaxID=291179 RepID=A0A5C6ZJ31_9FLAO|nr:aspartyl protease family protein [Subsaximicrobium wynnwilliamsii]TXD84586.1 PDZ domain-containing protein [Subsaximicrobium wynnwilliamsii]TXD90268.1 PDZ domain-containing protein [Subsaximicrobium wynnwilliamsii]TXE04319.1 PDZ domain-containing protein [Subsaximicrobium wynnwilliamsii]